MIVRTRNQGQMELRAFALTDMVRWGYNGLRSLTPSVGEREIRGIPAIHRAFRLRAEKLASLRLYCWRGEAAERERVDTVWQAKLFAKDNPNECQTRFAFWETVEESLCYRGNAYIWKTIGANGRVLEWVALHPDQIEVEKDGSYTVKVAAGYVDPTGKGPGTYKHLDCTTILHIRGHGNGGQLVAPSPIEVFRDRLAAPIGRQRHENRMWRRGTAIQQAIEFPANVSKDQADMWRESFRGTYEGTDGDTTMVLGGGGVLKPIGMTMADAQFVAMAHLTIEDAALIAAMPAEKLGVPLVSRPPDMEQIDQQWLDDGFAPELFRIESAIAADESFGFTTATTYPAFNTSGFVRGDLATEAAIVVSDKQAGIITANEARSVRGYPRVSDPAADTLQETPVGGAPNAAASKDIGKQKKTTEDGEGLRDINVNVNVPQPDAPTVHVETKHVSADPSLEKVFTNAFREIRDASRQGVSDMPAPVVNVAAPVVNVEPPDVTVNVEAPNVQVDAPVTVEAAQVTVQPAPVTVIEADEKARKVTVARGPQGLITGLTIEEE